MAPRDTVQAPPRQPPRQSLLTFAQSTGRLDGVIDATTGPDTEDPGEGEDWANGAQFEPPTPCPGSAGELLDPCDASESVAPLDCDPAVEQDAFDVAVAVETVTRSEGATDAAARARRLLNIRQHTLIAAEFWRGDKLRAAGGSGRYLAMPEEVDPGEPGPVIGAGGATLDALDALAFLEAYLAGTCGIAGVIHASVGLVTVWQALNLLTNTGGLLATTAFGTPVVSGPGYVGSAPSEGDEDPVAPTSPVQWAYGTGLLEVRLGVVRTYVSVEPATNVRTVVASRAAAVTVDDCCHVAVNIDASARC